jgi:hypothetical protein
MNLHSRPPLAWASIEVASDWTKHTPGAIRDLAEAGEIRSRWIGGKLTVAVEDLDGILEPRPALEVIP